MIVGATALGVVLGAEFVRHFNVPPSAPRSIAQIYEELRMSVVDLQIEGHAPRVGSGVVIGPHEIITARHLIPDSRERIVITTASGERIDARVKGTDARTDLALLTVESDLMPAEVSSSASARVGDQVFAVGNPFGLGHSVSVGVIGATKRRLDRQNGPQVELLQLSIPLNPGNSGGPIFDREGRMVGLLTGTHTQGQGIGFAVPSEIVAASLPNLRLGKAVSRAFLGVRLNDTEEGVRVDSVLPEGPAARAGLQPGDLIASVDGHVVGSTEMLYSYLDTLTGSSKITATFYRDQELLLRDIQLVDWSQQPVVIAGMTLRPSPGTGGIVVAVRPRSRAAHAGIQANDIVQAVNGLPVRAPADAKDAIRSASAVQLGIKRNGESLLMPL